MVAVADINVGEVRVQMAVAMPAAPVRLAVAGSKWACDRIGPVAFGAILVALAASGIWWYARQPEERREQVKDAAGTVGRLYMGNYAAAAQAVSEARATLRGSLVHRPAQRSATSAVLRELAMAPGVAVRPADRRPAPPIRPPQGHRPAAPSCAPTTRCSTRSAAAATSSACTTSLTPPAPIKFSLNATPGQVTLAGRFRVLGGQGSKREILVGYR